MSTPDVDALNARLDRIDALLAVLGNQNPPTPIAAPADDGANAERLKAIREFLDKLAPGAGSSLTPVNGALGETIGKLLDGKKSGIGLIGSVLTSIIGQSDTGSMLGKVVGAVTGAVPALSGLSGPMLPIFLAMTAWGFLGKAEKWRLPK